MKSIAIGNPSFETLIRNGYVYVDKTDMLYELIREPGSYVFCSRPRRFGKTLTLSTLEAIFRGKKELFRGLMIHDMDYDWKEYPVVHIDLGSIQATDAHELKKSLKREVERHAERYSLECDRDAEYYDAWKDLILGLSRIDKVVILIDEYDKVLSSNIYNPEAERMRDVLRGFFEVIKSAYDSVRFVFITGVTKFAKVSIFSSMNNLNDISMDGKYASLFGYTDSEVRRYFPEHIEEGLRATGLGYEEYMARLKDKYDGYRFTAESETTLYNPVSVGTFFSKGGSVFDSYWVSTGSMKLLMDIAKRVRFDITKDAARPIRKESITSFDILSMASSSASSSEYRSLMFQSGYLTITGIDEDDGNLVTLGFPNEEVAEAYSENLLGLYAGKGSEEVFMESKILKSFSEGNLEEAIAKIRAIYEAIPYDLSRNADELYYSSVFFSMLKALGADIGTEIETKKGRMDALLETDRHIYVIEFKYGASADAALGQIHDKGYFMQFLPEREGKAVHLVGISFSKEERNIGEWKEEML